MGLITGDIAGRADLVSGVSCEEVSSAPGVPVVATGVSGVPLAGVTALVEELEAVEDDVRSVVANDVIDVLTDSFRAMKDVDIVVAYLVDAETLVVLVKEATGVAFPCGA